MPRGLNMIFFWSKAENTTYVICMYLYGIAKQSKIESAQKKVYTPHWTSLSIPIVLSFNYSSCLFGFTIYKQYMPTLHFFPNQTLQYTTSNMANVGIHKHNKHYTRSAFSKQFFVKFMLDLTFSSLFNQLIEISFLKKKTKQ